MLLPNDEQVNDYIAEHPDEPLTINFLRYVLNTLPGDAVVDLYDAKTQTFHNFTIADIAFMPAVLETERTQLRFFTVHCWTI